MAKKIKMTPSLEDYLEMIYFLSKKNDKVRVTDMANELDISKPSVNKAVNTLKEKGLVTQEPYSSLYLSDKGLKLAKSIARRHHIFKRFLVDLLGVDKIKAEDEACSLEHSVSSETIDLLEDYLNKTLGDYKNID